MNKKSISKFFYRSVLLPVFIFISAHLQAGVWYVNDESTIGDALTTAVGNNGNPGTSAAPFLTIAFAISTASAGDTIYVDAGTYNGDVLVDQENFEVDNKIEFYRMLFLDLNKTYNIVFKIYDKTSGNLIEERFASTENLKNNGLFTRK
jgi:hypothetical protein